MLTRSARHVNILWEYKGTTATGKEKNIVRKEQVMSEPLIDPWQLLIRGGMQALAMASNIFVSLPWWQQLFVLLILPVALFGGKAKRNRRRW